MRPNQIAILSLTLLFLLLAACNSTAFYIQGSGVNKSAEFKNTDFDTISVSSLFKVYIEPSQDYQVTLTVDEKLIDFVRVEQNGRNLSIFTEGVMNIKNGDLTARIKMPVIEELDMSGMSIVKIAEGFDLDKELKIDISGMSKLQCIIRARDIKLDISGNSYAEFSGTGRDLEARISGSSNCDMRKIRFRDVEIECSGMSKAYINLNGDLDAKASGLSEIYYTGVVNEQDIETSGGAKIKQL
ncbi:MAG: DUF2807 domain-containing protein [Spirochaetales bacterium]|nr:DUF2807 domain-containing protein [Spirochaetales bacterium]